MKKNQFIAFSEKELNECDLSGIKTIRLRIDGKIYIGVPLTDLNRVCEEIGVQTSEIKKTKTDYNGICLASISPADRIGVSKMTQNLAILKRKYMQLCGAKRKTSQIKTLKGEIKKLSTEIEGCQQQLVVSLRDLEEKQQDLQALQGTDETGLTRFAEEFDKLLEHPDIERLEINNKQIVVFTKPILIAYNKADYNIGRFKITIHTDGSRGGVRMINLTRTIDGYHHPHIQEHGVPCLGNIQEVIPHMIAEHKYPAMISICIQYLKSYDNSAPHILLNEWPELVKKKGGRE